MSINKLFLRGSVFVLSLEFTFIKCFTIGERDSINFIPRFRFVIWIWANRKSRTMPWLCPVLCFKERCWVCREHQRSLGFRLFWFTKISSWLCQIYYIRGGVGQETRVWSYFVKWVQIFFHVKFDKYYNYYLQFNLKAKILYFKTMNIGPLLISGINL